MKIKTNYILLFTFILYFLALYTGYSVLWYFAIFTSAILIMALIMIITAIFLIKFDQKVSYPIIKKGMSTDVILEYKNKSIFIYPLIKLNYYGGGNEKISILPGIREHLVAFKPEYKGVYDIGVEKIEINDFFDLFKFSVKLKKKEKIYVLPCVGNYNILSENDSGDYINKDTKVNKIENKNIISDLREYKYGDTLNKINWKATAKFNEVIVNNYENKFSPKTFIYVGGIYNESNNENNRNINAGDKKAEDKDDLIYDDFACEIAVTLINNILLRHGQLSIFYNGKERILNSAEVQSINEYSMYLTERSTRDTYEEDLTTIENIVLNKLDYNKVVFILRFIHKDIYDIAKALRSNNIECNIYRLIKSDENKLGILKIDDNIDINEREKDYV